MVFHVVLFCRALSPSPPPSSSSFSLSLSPPASPPSFLSFSREINTHGWAGRATGEPRRLGDELREGTFGRAKNCGTRNIIAPYRLLLSRARPYIGNNFDPGSPDRHCIRKSAMFIRARCTNYILHDAVLALSDHGGLRAWHTISSGQMNQIAMSRCVLQQDYFAVMCVVISRKDPEKIHLSSKWNIIDRIATWNSSQCDKREKNCD